VNSPVRAFKAVEGPPLFIDRGEGAYLVDVDGNRFVDHVLSWGPLILGHAHPAVVSALHRASMRGTSYGAPCEAEVELATEIRERMPALEMIRMVNSGTEAVMSALRLARAFTGRSRIVKFEGCYHGHADPMLVRSGSGVATLALPDSPGVPEGSVADTLLARFNDASSVEDLFDEHPDGIAAVIVEPVAGNMGLVLPHADFLPRLRALTERHGALLVFDEVMTGFRVGAGGAQGRYGVRPDLTTLGKVIGGGLPVGALGGRADIMEMLAPSGPVYQAGTLSGNPLAMEAGLATLRKLALPGTWARLETQGRRTAEILRAEADAAAVAMQIVNVGSMFGLFFAEAEVCDWTAAAACDRAMFSRFFRGMLENGVYLAPSPFEAGFVSTAHGDAELERLADAARAALGTARRVSRTD
jgi:glutamate-1-semialdehyde 2,1-aminomutase